MLTKLVEDNIRDLRQAKQKAEVEEGKGSLAAISDEMIKDSFQSSDSIPSKMDILHDNHTQLTAELRFNPNVYNCGKWFK